MTYNKNKLSIQNFDYNPTLMKKSTTLFIIVTTVSFIHSFPFFTSCLLGPKTFCTELPGATTSLLRWNEDFNLKYTSIFKD